MDRFFQLRTNSTCSVVSSWDASSQGSTSSGPLDDHLSSMEEDKERFKRRLAGRIHQRRYREKFAKRVENLEAKIADIRAQLRLTGDHKHALEHQLQSQIHTKGRVHLSMVHRFSQLFLTGWCANPQSLLREKQLTFIEQSFQPNLQYLGMIGIGHWVRQMQQHNEFFTSTFLDIQRTRLIAQGDIVMTDVVFSLRLMRKSLSKIFPHLHELPQASKVIHQVLHIPGKYLFYFEHGKISEIVVDLDVLSGLNELLQDTTLAIQVIRHSNIQGNAYIL